MTVLDRLAGTWELTMRHVDVDGPVSGRHRYEPVLEGAFVQLHWRYDRPDFPDAIVLLSADRYHYFDVRGGVRVFELTLGADGWSMVRLHEEFSQRSSARFVDDDTLEVTGERSYDGGATWEADHTLTLRRDVAPSGA